MALQLTNREVGWVCGALSVYAHEAGFVSWDFLDQSDLDEFIAAEGQDTFQRLIKQAIADEFVLPEYLDALESVKAKMEV